MRLWVRPARARCRRVNANVGPDKSMFTWLNKQGVRSSDGFEVQFTSRDTAEYREGHRYLVVDIEGGANGFITFDKSAFKRFANSAEENSPDKQAQIMKNFIAAL